MRQGPRLGDFNRQFPKHQEEEPRATAKEFLSPFLYAFQDFQKEDAYWYHNVQPGCRAKSPI